MLFKKKYALRREYDAALLKLMTETKGNGSTLKELSIPLLKKTVYCLPKPN